MTRVADGYEIDWMQVVPRIVKSDTRYTKTPEFLKHDCGMYLRGDRIVGKHSDKRECGAKCTGATGPACECKCSGENHGVGA
jgi:hypothetical protein